MSDNEHVLDLVDDYLHDLLPAARAAHVERHSASCPACKAALEEARHRLAALLAMPPCEASRQLLEGALHVIAEHERRRRRWRRRVLATAGGLVAATVLVLGGLQIYYANLKATPYDLIVLGQRELLAATNAALRVRLLNRRGDKPLAGVPVRVQLRGPTGVAELANFVTDAFGAGQPRFRLPDWADGDYELHVVARTPDGPEEVTRPVRLTRSWKVMLTSDKPVYQPGQTIHVRALGLRRPDLLPAASRAATFTLADPRGNVVFKEGATTSRYGIAATDCPLAREITEGAYTLACKLGDTESRLRVEVRKYVLPKFKLDVKLDRPYYRPGDTVRCTVRADYFFGKHVAGALLEAEVRAPKEAEPLLRLTGRTNDEGTATFTYRIADQADHASDNQLSFEVSVTDTAGQKQTDVVAALVTKESVRIEVIPEGGRLVAKVPNRVYLMVRRADGTPVRAWLTVTGIRDRLRTDENGLTSFEITPRNDEVPLRVVAADEHDVVLAERSDRLQCNTSSLDFLLRPDRAVYRAGETMRLTALGGGTEPVFVDFIQDGHTLLTQTMAMADGRGTLAVDLPPDLFGTMRLVAYRSRSGYEPVTRMRVVQIERPGQLHIKARLDRKEYRPGGKARLDLTLTDAKGAACPGAFSLVAVDEAVFAVLGISPGTESAFFTVAPELARTVTAIMPGAVGLARQGRVPATGLLPQVLAALAIRPSGSAQARWGRTATPAPHSLTASTHGEKDAAVEAIQAHRLAQLRQGWVIVAVGVAFGFPLVFWILSRRLLPGFVLWGIWTVTFFGILYFVGRGVPPGPAGEAGLAIPELHSPMPQGAAAPVLGGLERSYAGADLNGTRDLTNLDGELNTQYDGRIREFFPETLLWRPQVITDDHGHASLDIDLADSITTWRLAASAVTADGRLGATQTPLKVFQPFFVDLNLPVTLTRGDEVSVPVVVHNHLDRPQTVTLALADGDWFDRLGARQRLDLGPREVRAAHFRLRVRKVGTHPLLVRAAAGDVADAIGREIEVVPDGRGFEQVVNGTLRQPAHVSLVVPADAIDGSVRVLVKIYPSSFSQVVEGLDGIFHMPSGCFEQTSSTTYPNIFALDYLRRTGKAAPKVNAKARRCIQLGYQRLVGFEIEGGGFDWFGRPPANRTLTAYGLMEFEDMARVYPVDAALIARTRRFLLDHRDADGSWAPEDHLPHDAVRAADAELARLSATAYIAWAVFARGNAADQAAATRAYLLSHRPRAIADPYVLALVGNALLALDARGDAAVPYLDRLAELKRGDGEYVYWEQAAGGRTTFYGAGRAGSIETTALAALALLEGKRHPAAVRGALAWLVTQKDAHGTWHSTQATVLSLKALLAGTDRPLGDGMRRVEVRLGDHFRQTLVIPADQAEVMKQLDLSPHVVAGIQRLTLTETTGTAAGFQVSFRYHVPGAARPADADALAVALSYDRDTLAVGGTLAATARITNRMKQPAAMVLLEVPVPPGFVPRADDFAALVKAGTVAKFELASGRVLVYLRSLAAGASLELAYQMRATTAGKVAVPGARAYEYYAPQRRGQSLGTRLSVTE